ncbi:UNKNOWN [Stylonychia lemnae]|uniref:Uncharacterized protein n=1 Tax=Stylonychia lemnae TaxID=5949 RepID=A0A078AC23_STYLE|nr:UNKNOWN [Stylonychia lemnae]|eukprot:CDW79152.1 UNKNOWN [Stylonychia lemnae]
MYKEKADHEEQNVKQKKEQLLQFEKKGSIMANTLELEEKKYQDRQNTLAKEKEKLQKYVKERYWILNQVEESSNEIDSLMAEKQELLRKKRELRDSLQHLEDKEKEVKSRLQQRGNQQNKSRR